MSWSALRWVRVVLASVVLAVAFTQAAVASPGCTSLNGNRFADGSTTGTIVGMDFEAGEIITLVLANVGSVSSTLYLQNSTTATPLTSTLSTNGTSVAYLVTANTSDTFVIGGVIGVGGIASWSCIAGGAGFNLNQFKQIHGVFASVATNALVDILVSVTARIKNKEYFSSGDKGSVGPNGINMVMGPDGQTRRGLPDGAFGLGMGSVDSSSPLGSSSRLWETWADARISGNGGDDIKGRPGRFTWDHLMIASGAHYLVAPGVLVGGFGSIENFGSERTDTPSKIDGRGVMLGSYGAWQVTKDIMFDGNISHTWLDYSGVIGAVGSDFNASRWMVSSRLSGHEKVGSFILSPQAEVSWLREKQDAYLTSLGAPIGAQHLVSGGANTGVVVSLPLPINDGLMLMPFVGSFADYRFGVEDKSSGTILGFGDGWSLRMRGGATVSSGDAWSITLDGDLGNVGGKGGEYYTGHLNGSLRF